MEWRREKERKGKDVKRQKRLARFVIRKLGRSERRNVRFEGLYPLLLLRFYSFQLKIELGKIIERPKSDQSRSETSVQHLAVGHLVELDSSFLAFYLICPTELSK